MTEAQAKQRAQYEGELAKAEAILKDLKTKPRVLSGAIPISSPDQMPWNRAAVAIPILAAQQLWTSSVGIVTYTQCICACIADHSYPQAWLINAAYKVSPRPPIP